ncbi:hypothetical protein K1T71_010200 [Dendrolimus kikuchii]|uniref:Uncharacterized protein n=1 Tax=Dendrolimus kikuchii TaxID=765133 RepID=A0ACC1CRM1_9NEOP|nr:hypothetical protein K1T71_010200 [Dendrolimus kikuchii]
MQNNIFGHLSFNYKGILIDEIALEGLEGISLPMLWKRVEKRISAPITEKMKIRLWNYIIKYEGILLYVLPEPAPVIEIIDRFDHIHEISGYLDDAEDYFDGPYEYCPVKKEYGSCKHYQNRVSVDKEDIKRVPYSEVESKYGSTLVMVASLEDRWLALASHIPITYLSRLTQPQYCILELIGRGRHNGQTTTGKTNLMKISKDPKLLFYNRKCLQDNDLIRVHIITQNVCGKGTKSLLLRLKRFHEQTLKSIPKRGIIRNIIDHLLTKPGFCDRTEEMFKKGLLTSKQSKKLQKKVNIFNFEDKEVPIEGSSKSQKKTVKKKMISLTNQIDESSHSESEEDGPPVKCQYKVGVGLLRQAYELFLEAGLKGLTFMEIAQLLGVRFYTCRAICRVLKQSNLLREFLEDKGRQRKARYIAVAATRKMDIKYAEEKEKLLNFFDKTKINRKRKHTSTSDTQDTEIPAKKTKEETKEIDTANTSCQDKDSGGAEDLDITELKIIDGLQNSKSLLKSKDNLTLRQLRYANGILKLLNDKLCISGYTTLSNLVGKEINEPPMASKSIKAFIQKLVSDGYIKIFNVKWPGEEQRYSKLICAADVKRTDPVIVAKCKEIRLKAIPKRADSKIKPTPPLQKFYMFTNWPRYAKIQKLHECLMNFAYFTPVEPITHSFPKGFVLVADFIPSLTVQFVVSNISKPSITDVICSKVTADLLPLKMGEVPKDTYEVLLKSNSFITTIKENLKNLAMLGLIQLVYYPSIPRSDYYNSSLFSFLVYINRHAKILDTRGEWPRKEVDTRNLEISYHFESVADVHKFWEQVFNISIYTNITVSNRTNKKKLMPPVRVQDEVHTFDNGERYGDEMGPCGYDSFYYMEIPWFWRTSYPKIKAVSKKILQPKKKLKINVKKVKKNVKKKPSRKQIKEPPQMVPRLRKCSTFAWSKTEDLIIILCKIAASIMSPSPQVGSFRIKNIVAKDLICLVDPRKTLKLCSLRAKTLENDSIIIHNMECVTNYIRRNKNLMQKYEGLLRKIRLRHSTNWMRYVNVARVAMIEMVWNLSQAIQSGPYINRIGCIAKSYEEFHENYTLTPSSANQQQNAFKFIDNATLKEAIIMSVMLSFKSSISNILSKKIYSIFEGHSEVILRINIEQMRKSGILAAKEKSSNAALGKQHFKNIVQSGYKISSLYQRKWNCRLNNNFVDTLSTIVSIGFPQTNIKGTPEINCFMCEMQTLGVLDVVCATVPVITGDCGTNILQEENMNVIDIETKFRLKSGTLGWKNKTNVDKFSDLFEDIIPICKQNIENLTNSYIVTSENYNKKDNIISHLFCKGDSGASFDELKNECGFTTEELKEKLRKLEFSNVIKRVGYYENILVLSESTNLWTINVGEEFIRPAPWLTFDKEIRMEVLFKWAGVVMNKIYENPGCSVVYLSDSCEMLNSRHVQDICMFLEKCQCVTLKNLVLQEVDLFSEDDTEPVFEDYNEYSGFDVMLAFPTVDSLTKYAYIRKKMLATQQPQVIPDLDPFSLP